jgi:hypothetical protein
VLRCIHLSVCLDPLGPAPAGILSGNGMGIQACRCSAVVLQTCCSAHPLGCQCCCPSWVGGSWRRPCCITCWAQGMQRLRYVDITHTEHLDKPH